MALCETGFVCESGGCETFGGSEIVSYITDELDNIDRYNSRYKIEEQIRRDAFENSGGELCSG